jgi:RND family efflux transporter MFP subunit
MKFNKKFFVIFGLAAAAGLIAYINLKPKAPVYRTEKVVLGGMVQEVAETGSVKKGEALNLNFKNSGAAIKVNVAKGDQVAAGQVLAELDARQLQVQLAQARANSDLYNLQLKKLQTGASPEDIGIVKSQAQAAEVALGAAQKSLADARTSADQKLSSAYKTAGDALSAAYAKAYNGYNYSDLLQRTYFAPQDADSIFIWEMVQKMNVTLGRIKSYADAAQANGKDSGLDPVFGNAKLQLAAMESDLRAVRAMCEKVPWRDSVSQAHKENLDLHIGYIVAAEASFNSAAESIALQKSANDLSVNAALSAVDAAAAALKTAGGQLSKTTASPRSEDAGMLEAQIAQAKSQIELLELQINDTRLVAPAGGQIIDVNVKIGETVSALSAAPAMVLQPADPFTVEVDIYEEEAIKVKIGDAVKVSIAAMPDREFLGKVIFGDPAGKLINGVVYYPAKIAFDDAPAGLKPDMTADVEIVTAQKENILTISETALQKKKDGGYFVQVLENGQVREAPVQIGIKAGGRVEIVSGLKENEEVVIP